MSIVLLCLLNLATSVFTKNMHALLGDTRLKYLLWALYKVRRRQAFYKEHARAFFQETPDYALWALYLGQNQFVFLANEN